MKHYISLGAGVQSSTMALMFACGELTPMPDGAIFADTQAEPQSVYEWLDWLEKQLPFPVHRVTAGNLTTESVRPRVSKKNGRTYYKHFVPTFGLEARGSALIPMMLPRKCTTDFKLVPLDKAVRRLAGIPRGCKEIRVVQFIGISADEAIRMKSSRHQWAANLYPLVDRAITRQDCLAWMKAKGHPAPPRSACVYCPYHTDREWKRLKEEEPDEFEKAVAFETAVSAVSAAQGIRGSEFLHHSRKPLDTVDFRSDVEHGQGLLPGFTGECEGLCGV